MRLGAAKSYFGADPEDLQANTRESVQEFQSHNLFTDITFHFPDGSQTFAHSTILSQYSHRIAEWMMSFRRTCICGPVSPGVGLPNLDLLLADYDRDTMVGLLDLIYYGSVLGTSATLYQIKCLAQDMGIVLGDTFDIPGFFEEPPETPTSHHSSFFSCPLPDCGSRFNTGFALKRHVESHHPPEGGEHQVLPIDPLAGDYHFTDNENDTNHENMSDEADEQCEVGLNELPDDFLMPEGKRPKRSSKAPERYVSDANGSRIPMPRPEYTCFKCDLPVDTVSELKVHLIKYHYKKAILSTLPDGGAGLKCLRCPNMGQYVSKDKLLLHCGLFHFTLSKFVSREKQPQIYIKQRPRPSKAKFGKVVHPKPPLQPKLLRPGDKVKVHKPRIRLKKGFGNDPLSKARRAFKDYLEKRPNSLECSICIRALPTKALLMEHWARKHFPKTMSRMLGDPSMPNTCIFCQQAFEEYSDFINHCAINHQTFLYTLINLPPSKRPTLLPSPTPANGKRRPSITGCHVCCHQVPVVELSWHLSLHFMDDILRKYNLSKDSCQICQAPMSSKQMIATHLGATHDVIKEMVRQDEQPELFLPSRSVKLKMDVKPHQESQTFSMPNSQNASMKTCCQRYVKPDRKSFKEHMVTHFKHQLLEDNDPDGNLVCVSCEKPFQNTRTLARHVGIQHGKVRDYMSPEIRAVYDGDGTGDITEEFSESEEMELNSDSFVIDCVFGS